MMYRLAVAVASAVCVSSQLSVSDDTVLDRDSVPAPTPKPTDKPETIGGVVADVDLKADIVNGNYPDGFACIDHMAWKHIHRQLQDLLRDQGQGPCEECHNPATVWTSLPQGQSVKACGTEPSDQQINWLNNGVKCFEREKGIVYHISIIDNSDCQYCKSGSWDYWKDHEIRCGPRDCWPDDKTCNREWTDSGAYCGHCCSGKDYTFFGMGPYCGSFSWGR